jgi:hypothetical protein
MYPFILFHKLDVLPICTLISLVFTPPKLSKRIQRLVMVMMEKKLMWKFS